MKICGLKLKIFSICSPFLLLVFLLVGHGASAEITQNPINFSYKKVADDGAGNFTLSNTIPTDCSNPLLIATVIEYYSYGGYTFTGVKYDGIDMTPDSLGIRYYIASQDAIGWQNFYITNPSLGTKNFSVHWSRGAGSDPMTIILRSYCGVDQSDPLDTVLGVQSGYSTNQLSSGYFTISNNESAVIYQGLSYPNGTTFIGTVDYTATTSGSYYDQTKGSLFYNLNIDTKTIEDNYFVVYDDDVNSVKAIDLWVLNLAPDPTKIRYLGLGTETADHSNILNIPYFADFCHDSNFSNISEVVLYSLFDYGEGVAGNDIILYDDTFDYWQDCLLSGTYQTELSEQLGNSGSAALQLDIYYNDGTPTKTISQISPSSFDWEIYQNPDNYVRGSAWGFDSSFTQIVDTSIGTSTEVQVVYDFSGLDDWASSTICVYNIKAGVDTEYCFIPTEQSGFGEVFLPYSVSNNFDLYFRWHATFTTNAALWDNNVFHMIWEVFSDIPNNTTGALVCQPPLFNLTNICIDDDTGAELGTIACGLKTGLLYTADILISPSCQSFNYFNKNYSAFKTAFPYNIFFEFLDTLDSAIDTATASRTEETFGLPFVRKTATGTEYYIEPMVSSSTLSKVMGDNGNNYIIFRNVEEYIYWILGALGVFLIIKPKKEPV
jgi:hypothetical protein